MNRFYFVINKFSIKFSVLNKTKSVGYIFTTISSLSYACLELVRIELGFSPSDIIKYERFGLGRFATGTHSQRQLRGL